PRRYSDSSSRRLPYLLHYSHSRRLRKSAERNGAPIKTLTRLRVLRRRTTSQNAAGPPPLHRHPTLPLPSPRPVRSRPQNSAVTSGARIRAPTRKLALRRGITSPSAVVVRPRNRQRLPRRQGLAQLHRRPLEGRKPPGNAAMSGEPIETPT